MKSNNTIRCIILLAWTLLFSACQLNPRSDNSKIDTKKQHLLKQTPIIVGAEKTSEYLPLLKNKNIAAVVNQTSMVRTQHLVDFLIESKQKLQIIFSPEHGFRGEKGAGEEVVDGVDKHTGIKIISLHGKIKKPNQQQLNTIDMLLFDIQDVGVRFYTYISTMHYLMEACAEYGIPMIVLDRPNPNGDRVDGPVLDLNYQSFIGMHPIPLLHGMTVGELAMMINSEGWLGSGKKCNLKVIRVDNYHHRMRYSLPIKPSTNLPNDESIRLYPSLGLFEGTSISVGRGTNMPFQVLGYPDPIMGKYTFTPEKISGSWSQLNYANEKLFGEKLMAKDVENNFLEPLIRWYQKFKSNDLLFFTRKDFFDKLAGGATLRKQILNGLSSEEINNSWQKELQQFKQLRSQYLLYPQ